MHFGGIMKVKDFMRLIDSNSKIMFMRKGKIYKIKNITDFPVQGFYKFEQIMKSGDLMDADISLIKGVARDSFVVKLKKE